MIQNAVYTRDVYRYKEDCVIGVLYHRGDDVAVAKKTNKMWLFNFGCVIEIIVFFDSFFAIFT